MDASGVAPQFVREGVAADEPTIVVTSPERTRVLRAALDPHAAERVSFFDARDWYQRPGRTLAAYRAALDEYRDHDSGLVCVVGDVQFGSAPHATARRARYEFMLNRAFADRSAWVVCAYNAGALPADVLADCRKTHPVISTRQGRAPSPEHFSTPELGAPLSPLADIRRDDVMEVAVTDAAELSAVRPAVVWPARVAGVAPALVNDLVLAVTELAESSRAHGPVVVRTGRGDGEWFCEVVCSHTTSVFDRTTGPSLPITIGRIICDRVELGDQDGDFVARFVFATASPHPRERILEAAAELFSRDGFRSTSVSAIAARAGVAKATFYKHFTSKDGLAATLVQGAAGEWLEIVRAEVDERSPAPGAALTTFFDVLAEWVAADVARGSRLLNVFRAIRDPRHPGHAEHERIARDLQSYLGELAATAQLPDPEQVAAELMLLTHGAIAEAASRHSPEPAGVAAAAARRLVSGSAVGPRGARAPRPRR
jgi:AcrR family transcriptional regulator